MVRNCNYFLRKEKGGRNRASQLSESTAVDETALKVTFEVDPSNSKV